MPAVSSSTGTAETFASPSSAFHSLNVEAASKQDNQGAEAGEIVVETSRSTSSCRGPTIAWPRERDMAGVVICA